MTTGDKVHAELGDYHRVLGCFAGSIAAYRCNAVASTIALRVVGSDRPVVGTVTKVSVMIEMPGAGRFERRTRGAWIADACTLGRVFIDLPGDTIELRLSGECRLLHLWFEPEVFMNLSAAYDDRPVAIDALRLLDAQALPTLIPTLCRTLLGGKFDRAIAIRALVTCTEQISSRPRRAGLTPSALRRVVSATDRPGSVGSLSDLAAIAGLSPFHFSRQFKHETNQSPYSFLLRRRVHHAMRHLAQSDDPIDGIAQTAGFTHASHMGRAFHTAFGMSPAAARRHLLP